MLEASQCILEKVDSTPFIIRAFLPMIKKYVQHTKDGGSEENEVSTIVDSRAYQWYKKYIYPLEHRITRMRPSLFAFRIILVASQRLK